MPSPSELINFWQMAAAEPLGIYLNSPDPVRLKSMLYSARAKSKDPSIAHLQLRTSPPDPELGRNYPGLNPARCLWIVNPPREAGD